MSHHRSLLELLTTAEAFVNLDNLNESLVTSKAPMRPFANLTLAFTSTDVHGGSHDDGGPTPVVAMMETEVTQAVVNSDSPMDVAMTILTVFVLSPLIICGNSLLLAAFRRYKRLRTPSNCLVASLAVADIGVGMFLPVGVYFELTKSSVTSPLVCLLPYCTAIAICSVSILSMTAIALDRYTSLAQPLRYNNIITKTSVGRYVGVFYFYALLMGASPIAAFYYDGWDESAFAGGGGCSFDLVGHHVRIFLFCVLYAPCAILLLFCYTYVYVVARYHAHAIYSVELSIRITNDQRTNSMVVPTGGGLQHHPQPQQHTFHPRYGRTLAITVGFFLVLWAPFQVCMLMDALAATALLRKWLRIYLAFVAFSNSALNPWIYGYRNAEFRLAFQRILEDLFAKLGVASVKKQQQQRHRSDFGHANGGGGELTAFHSCASNVRLCVSPNHLTMTTLLKPTVYVQAPSDSSCCGDTLLLQPPSSTASATTIVICETVVSTGDIK